MLRKSCLASLIVTISLSACASDTYTEKNPNEWYKSIDPVNCSFDNPSQRELNIIARESPSTAMQLREGIQLHRAINKAVFLWKMALTEMPLI